MLNKSAETKNRMGYLGKFYLVTLKQKPTKIGILNAYDTLSRSQ